LLVITHGAAGLIGAVEVVFSHSLRQRCLVHRCRFNLLAKVPTHAQGKVKAAFWQIFDDIAADPGEQAVAEARQRTRSRTATASATPQRSPAYWTPCPSSPASCAFLVTTGQGSATPT
jgi:transposase-like protein